MRLHNFILLLVVCFVFVNAHSQTTSPKDFLGYEIGDKFTYFHKVVDYFKLVDEESEYVVTEKYGESYEGRPLMVAYISHPKNLARLEKISTSNRSRSLLEKGEVMEDQPIIIWLSYNIHGNEAVSVETAMKMLDELVRNAEVTYKEWLEKAVIVIDPCLNPDGHSRYVQFYNERVGFVPNVNLFTREHHEPWPGGRPNHYLFDLNRDWAWQTQLESQYRGKLFNRWLPHVHVDFHEMGINEPYYFAPSAEPFHGDFPEWLKEFQNSVGQVIGESFDKNNWLYFKGEWFDLLYPSYGDTYPAFNGAVGMTFEQGGSGRAGLAGLNREGDTVTLKTRIEHHFVAGLKTIEVSIASYEKLLKNFDEFYTNATTKPKGKYLSYIVKNENRDNLNKLTELLDRFEIKYGYIINDTKKSKFYSYRSDKDIIVGLTRGDMIIPAAQPKGALLKVMFEPKTFLADSNTYDITAWALPYALGLDAYASEKNISYIENAASEAQKDDKVPDFSPIAYALKWESLNDAIFLAAALKAGLQPRVVHKPVKIDENEFDRGALMFTKAKHEVKREDFDEFLVNLAKKHKRDLVALSTGYTEIGPSFGSSDVSRIKIPHVGLLSGEGTNSTSVGEIWHFFEIELGYPISLFESSRISENVMKELDVLILSGVRRNTLKEEELKLIKNWVSSGGKLIAMENSVSILANNNIGNIALKTEGSEKQDSSKTLQLKTYADRNSEYITNSILGAIVRVQLDNTHPLAYGYSQEYFTLKTNADLYEGLQSGWNVGICTDYPVVSGFVGKKFQGKMNNFLMSGVEDLGSGKIIYFPDNPIFRSFWHAGKLMLCNAVFLVE